MTSSTAQANASAGVGDEHRYVTRPLECDGNSMKPNADCGFTRRESQVRPLSRPPNESEAIATGSSGIASDVSASKRAANQGDVPNEQHKYVTAGSRRYYHGGPPGLRVGDQILPPDVTGVASSKDFARTAEAGQIIRTDRVYLTTSPVAARMFAALHPSGRGWVYDVIPEGDVEPDPDCSEPGLSWEAPRASIVGVTALSQSALHRARRHLGVEDS